MIVRIGYIFLSVLMLSCLRGAKSDISVKENRSVFFISRDSSKWNGNWHWTDDANDFELKIKAKGDSITGSFCAVAMNGNRIDCSNEGDTVSLIKGLIDADSAAVLFSSCYSEGHDTAFIKFYGRGDSLLWRTDLNNILAWVPFRAMMKRRTE